MNHGSQITLREAYWGDELVSKRDFDLRLHEQGIVDKAKASQLQNQREDVEGNASIELIFSMPSG